MGFNDIIIFKEKVIPKKKIYIERNTEFMKELCREYQKNKLSRSIIQLFIAVTESITSLDQQNDRKFIVDTTINFLKSKFKKSYFSYQIERMNLDTDDKIIEKYEYFKYYYFKTYQEILMRKFPEIKKDFFTDISNHGEIVLKSDFNKELITKDNYLKLKQIKLTESTAKLFLHIFEENELNALINKNNFVFLISDKLIEKFPETALDYQTSRMGLSTISEIYERIEWFCYFYKEDILKIIYNKTDDPEIILKLKEIYDLN